VDADGEIFFDEKPRTVARLWARRYNGPANDSDRPVSLAMNPRRSEVLVTGTSYGRHTFGDYATIAYELSTGERLWARRYNGPENGFDSARALGVSSDGSSVFVAGARGSSFRNDYVIIAYAA
jgi:hypothetical protein